ncbi:MAG: hypothetical protein HZC29_00305 [Thaumarchaeota archaeon]|nr:hypothetical protein [Nitrososphaerota archaeon]
MEAKSFISHTEAGGTDVGELIRDKLSRQDLVMDADETVKILTGVFQQSILTVENRNRCLAILDKFAMAGWDKALDLLSSMERPD